MKKTATALILLLLAYAATSGSGQDLSTIEEKILKQSCLDVSNGQRCRIPSPYSETFKGVCCQGSCRAYASDCSTRSNGGRSLLDVMIIAPCDDRGTGEKCEIAEETAKKYNLYGTCCDGKCRYWTDTCGTDIYEGTSPPTQEQIESMAEAVCIGIGEGGTCNIPAEAKDKLDLYGVCCQGRCEWKKATCPQKPDLAIKEIRIQPEDPGKTLKLEKVDVIIQNDGGAPTESYFWVQLDKGDGSSAINQEVRTYLKADERTVVSFTDVSAYKEPRKYVLSAAADSSPNSVRNDLIAESDEDNNKGTWEIYIGERIDQDNRTDSNSRPTEAASSIRVDTPLVGDKTRAENTQGSDWGQLLLLAGIVIACLLAAVLVVYLATRRRGTPIEGEELQIQNLLKEKKTVEEMIELAKAKYHKRTLDEDSFKEIVKENQKKLIEIETRIGDLEARTKKLEEK